MSEESHIRSEGRGSRSEEQDTQPSLLDPHPSSYLVIARRYRPQTFDELVGQQHVVRALQQAITTDRVGHAYLFTGARGVGKTSAARILAKALNCVHGPTPTPCNECDVCVSVSTGEDVDVLEIDGASNNTVDEIRQLRQNVSVRPSRTRFKIYIIDEVHMLSKSAFNALLKTLEEPPEHVKFIFATTEPHKIPITILSRCQRFDFAGIDTAAIRERLVQIATSEGVEIEPAALHILASRAAGSMRDSQSLLEQLLATVDAKITTDEINALLGIAPAERISDLVRHVSNRDAAAALGELDAALAGGVDVGQLVDQLIGYWRDVMAAAADCGPQQFLYALPSQQDEVVELANQLGIHTILAVVQILDQTAARLRATLHGRTLVEMALVRLCHLEDLDELAALVDELRGAPSSAEGGSTAPSPATKKNAPARKASSQPTAARSRPIPNRDEETSRAAERTETATAVVGQLTPASTPKASLQDNAPLTDERAADLWKRVILQLGDTVASSAAHAQRLSARGDALVASFPASYRFCRDVCDRPEHRARIEQAVQDLCGRSLHVSLEVHDDPADAAPQRPARRSRQEQLTEVADRPFVRRAMELFGVEPGDFRYVPPSDDAS